MSSPRPLADELRNKSNDLEAQNGGPVNEASTQNANAHVFLQNPFADPPSLQLRRDSLSSVYSTDSDPKFEMTPQPPAPKKKTTHCCASSIFWVVSVVVLVILILSTVFTVLLVSTKKPRVRDDYGSGEFSRLNQTLKPVQVNGTLQQRR